jgi:hypothetical protein
MKYIQTIQLFLLPVRWHTILSFADDLPSQLEISICQVSKNHKTGHVARIHLEGIALPTRSRYIAHVRLAAPQRTLQHTCFEEALQPLMNTVEAAMSQ